MLHFMASNMLVKRVRCATWYHPMWCGLPKANNALFQHT